MLTYTQLHNERLLTAYEAHEAVHQHDYEHADICMRAAYSLSIAIAMMEGNVDELPEVQ